MQQNVPIGAQLQFSHAQTSPSRVRKVQLRYLSKVIRHQVRTKPAHQDAPAHGSVRTVGHSTLLQELQQTLRVGRFVSAPSELFDEERPAN